MYDDNYSPSKLEQIITAIVAIVVMLGSITWNLAIAFLILCMGAVPTIFVLWVLNII